MREHRKRIDRLQNLLIAVLVCTALVLINKTGMFRNLTGGSAGTPVEASFTGVQDTALSRQAPVALLIQTSSGRYGVQYDQDTVDGLYNNGLSTLLTTAIDHVEGVKTTTEEDWQDAVTQGDQWIFYDFLYDVAFTGQDSEGGGICPPLPALRPERPGGYHPLLQRKDGDLLPGPDPGKRPDPAGGPGGPDAQRGPAGL